MNECFFTFLVAPCLLFYRIGFLGHQGSFRGWVVFFLFIALSPTTDMGMHYPGPSQIAVGRWPSALSPLRDVPAAKSCLAQGHALLGMAHPRWLENKGLVILAQFGMMWKEHPSSRVPHGVGQGRRWRVHGFSFLPSPDSFSTLLQVLLSKALLTAPELPLRVCFPKSPPATSSVPAVWGH